MPDPTADYYKLVELLRHSDAEPTLSALAEGKRGNCEYRDFLQVEIIQNAEAVLDDFIKALENRKANELISGLLK